MTEISSLVHRIRFVICTIAGPVFLVRAQISGGRSDLPGPPSCPSDPPPLRGLQEMIPLRRSPPQDPLRPRLRDFHWQLRLLPGVEAADQIADVAEAGPLQQAAGDHAAISTLAVDGDGRLAIDLGR